MDNGDLFFQFPNYIIYAILSSTFSFIFQKCK